MRLKFESKRQEKINAFLAKIERQRLVSVVSTKRIKK
jgi:hypothetical protein